MPEVAVKKEAVLDILDTKSPALSTTSDMPVIETKPDASNEGKPPETKAAPEEKKPEGKTQGESATPPAESAADDEEPAKKPAKGVQKRLDELTRQREEAERRAKAAEENLRLALEGRERAKPPEPDREEPKQDLEEEPEPTRPNRADFSEPDAWDAAILKYADDKAAWTARREVKAANAAFLKKQQEQAQRDAQSAVIAAHNERVEKAKAKREDWAAVAESQEVKISVPMAHAIITSDDGPEIQYYLGSNPKEAERIAALPVPMQLRELGRISMMLEAKGAPPAPAAPSAPAAPPKPITSAPAPVKPAASGATDTQKSPDEMSMEEYAAYRKPQLAADRRPGGRRT